MSRLIELIEISSKEIFHEVASFNRLNRLLENDILKDCEMHSAKLEGDSKIECYMDYSNGILVQRNLDEKGKPDIYLVTIPDKGLQHSFIQSAGDDILYSLNKLKDEEVVSYKRTFGLL